MLDRDVVDRWQLDGLKSDVQLLGDELRREREAARQELGREMEWARADRRRLAERLDQLDRADGNHFLGTWCCSSSSASASASSVGCMQGWGG